MVARQRKDDKRKKKKEQKLKKERAKRAAMPAILRRDPLLAEALRYQHPLHSCLINENWREMKMATIFIVRDAPTGLVMSAFLVDLSGFGLKDAWGDYGLTSDDIEEIKAKSADDDMSLESCEPSCASSLIHGGVVWAKKWGIKLPKDYTVWMRMLAPNDVDSIDLDLFGIDGKPLFMVDEEDDNVFDEGEVDLNVLKDPLKRETDCPSREQLDRVGDIKGALINFATNPQFSKEYDNAKSEYSETFEVMEEEYGASFLDWYVLEWKSESGGTFPDRFVEVHGDLMSGDVRNMILGWRDVINGIFEIKGKRSGVFHMKNLINERKYIVYPTISIEDEISLEIGDFMIARIVPVRDYHVFSGIVIKIPCDGSDKEKGGIYGDAIKLQNRYPRMAFKDNDEKLKKSKELVRKDYDEFIDYFGSDELIGSGREIVEKYREYLQYRMFKKKDPHTGLSKAETYKREYGTVYQLPQTDFPEPLLKHPDVGMLCDPLDGITFLEEWSLFVNIFKNPDVHLGGWTSRHKIKDIIRGYLESDPISDMPFRRMAERYPTNFERVLGDILQWEDFSVDMIDDLMRRYKPETFDKRPSTVAVLDSEMVRFTQYLMASRENV